MLRPFAHPVACCCVLFSLRGRRLEVLGTRKNARARETRLRPFSLSPTTSKRLLHRLRIAGSCCAQFETGQSFERTTPNISSVPWSPKRSATMFDPFAQLFQHLFRRRTCITHSLVPHTYASWQWVMTCIIDFVWQCTLNMSEDSIKSTIWHYSCSFVYYVQN